MITGFNSENGYALRINERCVVAERGLQATYLGTVDVRMTVSAMDAYWTFHAGTFGNETDITTPGGNHDTQCFVRAWRAWGETSDLRTTSYPGLMAGETVKFLQHVEMQHTEPLHVFRRTSGEHGLETLKLQVGFTAGSLPSRIWQCEWQGDGAQEDDIMVLAEIPVDLHGNPEGIKAVSLDFEDIPPHRTFGFHWEW